VAYLHGARRVRADIRYIERERGDAEPADPVELRSRLLEIADEMTWVGSVVARGVTAGISWPEDAAERIGHLCTVASAWDPVGLPSAEVQNAARRCLGILQPGGA